MGHDVHLSMTNMQPEWAMVMSYIYTNYMEKWANILNFSPLDKCNEDVSPQKFFFSIQRFAPREQAWQNCKSKKSLFAEQNSIARCWATCVLIKQRIGE